MDDLVRQILSASRDPRQVTTDPQRRLLRLACERRNLDPRHGESHAARPKSPPRCDAVWRMADPGSTSGLVQQIELVADP